MTTNPAAPTDRTRTTGTTRTTGAGPGAPAGRRRRGRALLPVAAATLVLAGCGLTGDSWAVTYEVEVVSGTEDAELAVEYLTRQTGLSAPETTRATVPAGAAPLRAEAIGPTGEEVSVTATGVPGAVLRCAILLDADRVIAEDESAAPGEGVDCTTTTPASLDD